METLDIENAPQQKRPTGLKALCILSWIYIGLGLLGSLYGFIRGKSSEEEMLEMKVEMTKSISELKAVGMDGFADMMYKIQKMAEITNDKQLLMGLTGFIVLLIGLFGVIRMWQGIKLGFHLYIIYSILTIAQIYFFVSPQYVPTFILIWNVIISVIFILLYSRQLKWMQ